MSSEQLRHLINVISETFSELDEVSYNKKSEEEQIKGVRLNPSVIRFISAPSEAVQMAAVESNPESIKHIPYPAEAAQLYVVNRWAGNIVHINKPSQEAQTLAVKKEPALVYNISYVTKQTILTALLTYIRDHQSQDHNRSRVRNSDLMKMYNYFKKRYSDWSEWGAIENSLVSMGLLADTSKDEKQQIAIIRKTPAAIAQISNPSEAMQLAAVKKSGLAIRYITDPSDAVQQAAVKQNKNALKYIQHPSEAVQLVAVQNDAAIIEKFKNPSEAVQLAAVQNNPHVLTYIKNPSEAAQLYVVQQFPRAIFYIKQPTKAVQLAAISARPETIVEIKNPIRIEGQEIKQLILQTFKEKFPELANGSLYDFQSWLEAYSKYKELYPEWTEWADLTKNAIKPVVMKQALHAVRDFATISRYSAHRIEYYQKMFPDWPEWAIINKTLKSIESKP